MMTAHLSFCFCIWRLFNFICVAADMRVYMPYTYRSKFRLIINYLTAKLLFHLKPTSQQSSDIVLP